MLNFQEYQRLDEKINIESQKRKSLRELVKNFSRLAKDQSISRPKLAELSKDESKKRRFVSDIKVDVEDMLQNVIVDMLGHVIDSELANDPHRTKPTMSAVVTFDNDKRYVGAYALATRNSRTNNLSSLGIEIQVPMSNLIACFVDADSPGNRKATKLAKEIHSSFVHEITHIIQFLRRDNTVKDRVQDDTFEYGGVFTDEFRQYANYLARDREIEAHAVGAVSDLYQQNPKILENLYCNVRDKETLEMYAKISDSFRSYYGYFGPESMGSQSREGHRVWKRFLKKFLQHAQDALEND